MTNKNIWESFIVIAPIALFAIAIVSPELSFAGTGGEELQGVLTKTEDTIKGNFAKIVGTLAFANMLLGMLKGSMGFVYSAIGLGVVAAIGPTMITSGISALI